MMAGPDLHEGDCLVLFLGGPVTLDHTRCVVVRTIHLGHYVAVLPEGISGLVGVVEGAIHVLERLVLVAVPVPGKGNSDMPVLSAQLSHHDLLGAGVVAPLASKKRITH